MGKSKGRRLAAGLCSVTGILLLLLVVLACAPVALARIMGYEVYNVVSGSMEPALPVGSLVYVERAEPEDVLPGQIIAFRSGSSVVVHRVTENRTEERTFITKGDANAEEDPMGTPYRSLDGRVVYCLPMAGFLQTLYADTAGRAWAIGLAAAGAFLNLLAGRLRRKRI